LIVIKKILLPILLLTALCFSPASAEARRNPKPKLKPPQQESPTPSKGKNVAGQFDFYVLAMSWSPDYCASKSDPQQCGRQLGFVLHGLWPQYDRGWPADCTNEAFDPAMKTQFPDLYPSSKLYTHEWEKHGTCSGLTQPKFHAFAQHVKASVAIPDRYNQPEKPFRTTLGALKQEFVKANPNMSETSFAPACSGSGRFLQELRVCYGKDGQPGTCSAEVLKSSEKSCGQPDFLVRSVR
jgi:ribonuclease T2